MKIKGIIYILLISVLVYGSLKLINVATKLGYKLKDLKPSVIEKIIDRGLIYE